MLILAVLDWEQRNISNVSKLNPKSTLPQTFKYIDLESVDNNNILSHREENIHSAPSRAQRLAIKGDIFFQTVRPYQKNNILFCLDSSDYVFSSGYAQIRPIISNNFLFYRLQTDSYVSEVLKNCTGTSYPAINSKDLSIINFLIPLKELEQDKIGEFLNNIDSLVILHQREINILKKLKKAYLKEMFANHVNKDPNIRFKDFKEEWEQRKIEELFSERKERSAEGELISVTINSGVLKASTIDRKDNSSKDKSNYKVVKVGDIPYNSMRMWQGASGYSPYNGILSPAYTVLIPKENVNSKFFSYNFKRHEMIQIFRRNSQGLTPDTWNLKFPLLKNIKVKIPNIHEQNEISDYLERLDRLLVLHHSKLRYLKELKKEYLNKLFI